MFFSRPSPKPVALRLPPELIGKKICNDPANALSYAEVEDHTHVVEMLASAGAASAAQLRDRLQEALERDDVGAAMSIIREGGDSLQDALFDAARHGRVELVRALVGAGADPNMQKPTIHAMPLAAAPDEGTVTALVGLGADVNAENDQGESVLCQAVDRGCQVRTPVIGALIETGADVNHESKDGTTPLERANTAGNERAAQALRSHGGKVSSDRMNKLDVAMGVLSFERPSSIERYICDDILWCKPYRVLVVTNRGYCEGLGRQLRADAEIAGGYDVYVNEKPSLSWLCRTIRDVRERRDAAKKKARGAIILSPFPFDVDPPTVALCDSWGRGRIISAPEGTTLNVCDKQDREHHLTVYVWGQHTYSYYEKVYTTQAASREQLTRFKTLIDLSDHSLWALSERSRIEQLPTQTQRSRALIDMFKNLDHEADVPPSASLGATLLE